MDRLGRNARDLHGLVEEITAKGATVRFIRESITVDRGGGSLMESLMLSILAAFAQFERDVIADRQAEGIAIAKAQGKYRRSLKMSERDAEQAQAMVDMGIPKTQVAQTFEVSRETLYTALRRHANKEFDSN